MNNPQSEPSSPLENQLKELFFTPAAPEFHTRLEAELKLRPSTIQPERASRRWPIRLAAAGVLALALFSLLVVTPAGRSFAAQLFRFFIPAGTDSLPPIATFTAAPEGQPTAVFPYSLTLTQTEQQAGRDLLEPTWLPEGLSFVGGFYDPQTEAATLTYSFDSYDVRLSLIQGLAAPASGVCDLCDKVGESAFIETVEIGETTGEYVEGVWKMTDQGTTWESDPYLKTMRWQVDGVIYQIVMMGEEFGQAEMIRFAENLR